jgi:hypothetical protein
MNSFRTRLSPLFPYFIFVAVILVAWRDVLMTPGVVGHAWDWDMPAMSAQLFTQIARWFYIWDYQFRGGFYSPYRPEGLYWAFTLPFAFFGGEVFSKTIPPILMFISAFSMFQLARRALNLDAFWATLAGIMYMLSPAFYSRLMAGHMHILSPYAVLPLVLLFVWRAFSSARLRRISWVDIAGAGMFLGITSIHPSIVAIALVMVAVAAVVAMLRSGIRKEILLSGIFIGVIFSLVSASWAIPSGVGYITDGTIFHSGWPLQQPDSVTPASVLVKQETLDVNTIQLVREAMRGYASSSINTEFSFPIPPGLESAWTLASFLVPMLAFAVFVRRRDDNDLFIVIAILGLLGATLVSGRILAPGAVIAQFLLKNVLPVWLEYANTVRWLPLVCFANAALVPSMFQRISPQRTQATQRERHNFSVRSVSSVIAVVIVAIYTAPFWAGNLLNPNDPFALRMYQPAPDDQVLYDFMRADADDFRIAYVPPAWMYYPEYYDLGYEWLGGLSPRPEILRPYYEPDPWSAATAFTDDLKPGLSGDMLGLATVKYLVYPREKIISPYKRLLPQIPNEYATAARAIDRTLATQKNLVRASFPSTQTIVLRNESVLPHIYAATDSVLVHGNSATLPIVAGSLFMHTKPALFIETQQPTTTLKLLGQQTNSSVIVSSDKSAESHDSFIFPIAPLAEPSVTISTPVNKYVVRVQALPFQTFNADSSSAKFDVPDNPAWTSNTRFSYRAASNELAVSAYLDGASHASEWVEYSQSVDSIDLIQYPYLRLNSQIENQATQAISVKLGLDFDEDGVVDAEWASPQFSHAKLRNDDVKALDLVKREFSTQAKFRVVKISVRFERATLPEWATPNEPQTLYAYSIKELGLYADSAMSHRGFALNSSDVDSGVATLRQSLGQFDATREPVWVAYQVDGPAAMQLASRLIITDTQGVAQSFEAGTQIVEPFSRGALRLDVRNALANLASISSARVEIFAQRLLGDKELRSTTLMLTDAGALFHSTAQPTSAPTLMIDDKRFTFASTKQDAMRERAWFESLPIDLAQGEHGISIEWNNKQYAVESIEIEPAFRRVSTSAPQVTFRQINPTRYVAHIDNATAPFFLVFSESFQKDWKAYIQNASGAWYEPSALLSMVLDRRTELAEHVRANGFANSWYIDQTGSYEIVLEFIPQRMYEGGWLITFGTLLGCAIFMVVNARRGER